MLLIKSIAWFVTIVAAVINLYIYTYPSFTPDVCHWKYQYKDYSALSNIQKQLLNIPYIGDLYDQYFIKEDPLLVPETPDIRLLAIGDPQINGNWPSTKYIKRLDNFGNDYYLGHIYKVMKQRLHPTHVSVMGDLFSSQWIADSEFYNRTKRYTKRLFPRPQEHVYTNLDFIDAHQDTDWMSYYHFFTEAVNNGTFLQPEWYHFENVHDWTTANITDEPLFINISGNHDIGNGDTTFQHMARYAILFGKDNFWIEYDNDTDHPWRIVVLNSLHLDGPLLQPEMEKYDWQFIETLENRPYHGSTVLLTHVPMYKKEGLCVDGPLVEFYNAENCRPGGEYRIGLLKSENHLQYETSQRVLNAVFKDSKSGAILTGHDHEGCENFYNLDSESGVWEASKEIKSPKFIKEITVRSIMGDFHGNTGIFTGHFNDANKIWEYEYSVCPFMIQHVWWAAQVSLILSILLQSIAFLL